MITINTDQGIVNVTSWEDVLNIPGFTSNVNPDTQKLSTIIGRYLLSDKVPCGLSNCHTQHGRGYVVTTQSGIVTNIGKDCGTTYFGVQFEELSKKFNRDLDEKEMRERLTSFTFGLEDIESRIQELRKSPIGADWIYERIQALQTRGGHVPDEVIHRLASMVRTGSGSLTQTRVATVEEKERLRAMGTGQNISNVIEDQVGVIYGFEALYPENDLKKLIIIDLVENLKKFKPLNVDAMTYEQLKHWSKWASFKDTTLESIETSIGHGRRLLAKDNLSQFTQILKKTENNSFRNFLKSL